MADDLFDLFRREFDALQRDHRAGLKQLEQQHAAALAAMSEAARATQADISRTASAALVQVPTRIEAAFADGVADIRKAGQLAERAGLTLDRAGTRLESITRAYLLDHLYLMVIWLGGGIAAAFLLAQIYSLAKEPTYKDRWLLCTAAWADKTQTCKGKVYAVPEHYAADNRANKP
jgi:hypothetical protein